MDTVIKGVTLTPLKIIEAKGGNVLHALKSHEASYRTFGEAYFSEVYKNGIKGWKKHTKARLNLTVPVGKIRFVVYDEERDTFFETIISRENYQRLTVEPGLWMAFEGVGDLNMVLNLMDIEHDPKEALQKELYEIPYPWK